MRKTIEVEEKGTYYHTFVIEFDGSDDELDNILDDCDGGDHLDTLRYDLKNNGVEIVEYIEGVEDVEVEITDCY